MLKILKGRTEKIWRNSELSGKCGNEDLEKEQIQKQFSKPKNNEKGQVKNFIWWKIITSHKWYRRINNIHICNFRFEDKTFAGQI